MSAPDDTATVEHRIERVMALVTAMHCCAATGVNAMGNAAEACSYLALMADKEMGKVMEVLGSEVLNRDC